METTTTTCTHPVLELMRAEHRALERAFCDLLERAYEDDPDTLRTTFRELEAHLRSHLELEEASLLPAFARTEPKEAERLSFEHQLIRAQLDQLGVAIDLGAVRAHTVRDFVTLLRDHATREAGALYKWADTALSEPKRRPILQWLIARTEGRPMTRAS
jgi:Hemerythrin HHE cation binding domain